MPKNEWHFDLNEEKALVLLEELKWGDDLIPLKQPAFPYKTVSKTDREYVRYAAWNAGYVYISRVRDELCLVYRDGDAC